MYFGTISKYIYWGPLNSSGRFSDNSNDLHLHVKENKKITSGIYTAASGMLAEEAAQQIIAQNLANASTTGYKQDIPIFSSFEENLVSFADQTGENTSALGELGNGTAMQGSVTDLQQGSLTKTGNSFDLAMTGDAFLSVATAAGTNYTRDGALGVDGQGNLVQTASGLDVLDASGNAIQLPTNAKNITFQDDGSIIVDGKTFDKLGLFAIQSSDVPNKIGGNLLTTSIQPAAVTVNSDPTAGVRSGYLEQSNVNIVKEMVTMIAASRAYEANQKALTSQDEMQQASATQVGSVPSA